MRWLCRYKLLMILAILLIAIFSRFYQLEERYSFEWDQERDAQIVWQILKEGKLTLIGPRVLGPESFFLGPLWLYLLVPFYFTFQMDPIAAAVLTALIGVLTTVIIYWTAKRLLGPKEALIGGLLWAIILTDRISWSPALIPLASLFLLYCCSKIIEGENKFITLTFLFWGIALQFHFQAVLFIIPIITAILVRNKRGMPLPRKALLYGLSLLALTFLPLVIFDLRHNLINLKAFLSFLFDSRDLFQNSNLIGNVPKAIIKYMEAISYLLPSFPFSKQVIGLMIFIFSVTGIYISNLIQGKKFLLLSFLFAPILYLFFGGGLSEYYFNFVLTSVVLGVASSLGKIFEVNLLGKTIVLLFLFLIIGMNLRDLLLSDYYPYGLHFKKLAVSYIVRQKVDPTFNVSYSVPQNFDNGFRYLFKLYGREPRNIPEGHLWSIIIPANRDNINPNVIFGGIGVIRR